MNEGIVFKTENFDELKCSKKFTDLFESFRGAHYVLTHHYDKIKKRIYTIAHVFLNVKDAREYARENIKKINVLS